MFFLREGVEPTERRRIVTAVVSLSHSFYAWSMGEKGEEGREEEEERCAVPLAVDGVKALLNAIRLSSGRFVSTTDADNVSGRSLASSVSGSSGTGCAAPVSAVGSGGGGKDITGLSLLLLEMSKNPRLCS